MPLDNQAGDGEFNKRLIAEVLEAYPDKSRKRRQKHLDVARTVPAPDEGQSAADDQRAERMLGEVQHQVHPGRDDRPRLRLCRLEGRGVGPDQGHGAYQPWPGRAAAITPGRSAATTTPAPPAWTRFVTMQVTSDFQERDIVFGGDKKLEKIIDEIGTLFPLAKGITIQSECPIGLIGDDIEAVARKKHKETGKTIVPVRCEGFRGVSQSLGHHIANDTVRDWVFDKKEDESFETTPYDVNVIGDYNIGGDAWASRILLEEIGLRVVGNWSGDATLAELEHAPKAKLNLIHCYRSMNYICRHMEEKYNIPWMEYNFFGPSQIAAQPARHRRQLRPDHPGQRRAGDREVQALRRCRAGALQAAAEGQDGDALCRRAAAAPRGQRLCRSRHGNRRHRL